MALDLMVNGGPVQVPDGFTVAGLLERLGLDRRKVAVERNEEIVVRSTYETMRLEPGDRLEIVHFIGGG
jgi:thiamine biosynthesis protein ThiS